MDTLNFKKWSFGRLALAVLIFLQACSEDNKEATLKENKVAPIPVIIATPNNSANQFAVVASGQVEAKKTANISTRVMGFITNMHVKVGDKVSKGQLLVTISAQDMQAKKAQTNAMIAEAESALESAKKDYERYTNLYHQQSASAKELDNVTLQYQSMQSKVEAAKQMRNEVNAMLSYTKLIAPLSGVVTKKNSSAGDMANPGVPLLVIEQNSSYQVSASIPEAEINKIKLGTEAMVEIKSTGQKITGKVSEINPSSQFSGGQYLVKISIPENEKAALYAGMYSNINIPVKEAISAPKADDNIVMIPVESIIKKDHLTGLYTISNNNTALLRWVRLGKDYGDKVEVLSGLAKNETFIIHADGRLYNGVPVTIKK